jgi:hypothetical protein
MPFKHLLVLSILILWISLPKLSALDQLTNLPTIYINTVGGAAVASTSVWVNGFLTVVGGDSSDVKTADTIRIRGRGNSTWNLAKKPYRIKFDKKRHLLGLRDDAKDWVLLANHADKTLIRNAVAFEIGRCLNMEFTPSVRFADVYLNNVFLGNYMVTDQIERGGNRVPIEKLDSADIVEPNVSGGYLVERDGFNTREPVNFTTDKAVPFSVKEPDSEDIQPAQLTYIKNYLNQFEAVLFSTNWTDPSAGYRANIDTTSFLNWYIASELTGNIDCFWSTYMYKKRGDTKLYYGPLWDYDIAFNNDSRRNDISKVRMLTTAFNNKTWINQISTDTWFKSSVNRRWKEIIAQGIGTHLKTYIDSLATLLDASQKKNYEKWGTLSSKVYNEWYFYSTYPEYIDVLKAYIDTRVAFLTTSFATDAPVEPTAPFKLEKFYYSITNKASMTLMDVQDQSLAEETRVVHYSAVEDRQSQQWELIQVSDGTYQIINRYTRKALQSYGLNRTIRLYTPSLPEPKQQWKILPLNMGNGTYKIVNVSTGNVAENSSGSTADNTLVNEDALLTAESANQAWLLEKVVELETALPLVSTDKSLRLSQNPVSEQLQVRLEGWNASDYLEVFDLSGSLLKRSKPSSAETCLFVGDLADGLYLLKHSGNQGCSTIKFIVKH